MIYDVVICFNVQNIYPGASISTNGSYARWSATLDPFARITSIAAAICQVLDLDRQFF